MKTITATALKPMLGAEREFAFLDIREHGQYGEGHPFFCVSAPYSVIEARAPVLVPRKKTLCVLMDDGDGVSALAHERLAALGYENLLGLEGGAPAWAAAGYTLFKGVNVLSKTFGELVEHACGTPSISAEELRERQARSAPMIVLDGRSPSEFRKMSLPGARSCPNAELGYRLPELVADESTPVIVNCAGRTRSIIGAQSLRNLGLKNPVFALRNGTQGWRLAGFELDHGRTPDAPPALSPASAALARARAGRLVRGFGLSRVSPGTVAAWMADESRTTYLFDVRTEEEYLAAHCEHARHAPGGQLVQATDEFLAVRNARIVLSDDLGLRAASTAIWLRGMGHEVHLLDADASAGPASGPEPQPVIEAASVPRLGEIANRPGLRLLDASRGMEYRAGHVEGAEWVTRARLDARIAQGPILVLGRSAALVAGVMQRLTELGANEVEGHVGGPEQWRAAGLAVVATPDLPAQDDCIDYLFFVHDRHDDNLEAARQYLAWECGLLKQLDAQERGALNPAHATPLETV
ncbi:rhodanese-like domain-containing protein [Nitratireductor sp. ZSWI3]|uniref:rhodanese-like domain-containing protein n=1 Tax=Nitratireductor sp. ZSWI3 TaxID=2966359 RepID=UPI00214FA75D|nr:rhodanese-like domain-containing protein [Nitratireductor sp. ZSWI3]MCR4266895.1 rhodanese-like domain-containing protein [Nitratireductor sp. ZSWI3]